MFNLDQIKITRRDQQVINLLVQGCSNKKSPQSSISIPAPSNSTFARFFARWNQAGPQARHSHHRYFRKGADREQLNCTEIRIATLVWQGRTNPEIAGIGDTSEQVTKNHLRSIFDKLGVWSRLELALYVASHGGIGWAEPLGTPSTPAPLTAAAAAGAAD